jgi:hypothetical protein
MEFQKEFILTPYNYFAWKENIELTPSIEKYKYLKCMDDALGTICSLISPDLPFHISSCKNPNEA